MMAPPVRLAAFAALLGLGGAAGCRTTEALRQRCLSGEQAACDSACGRRIYGEGGCFHAGEGYRQRAGLEFGGADFRQASQYFQKSCEGGYGDGCLFAAQALEAPFGAPDPASPSADAPATITDPQILERERWLRRACDARSPRGCKRLGDVLLGKSSPAALDAYARSCDTITDSKGCKAARSHEVDVAERWRSACTHGSADDCSRLADLLLGVDAPRAVRLLVSECQLRGVAELSGGVGGFVRERLGHAGRGIPASREQPGTPSLFPAGVTIDIGAPVVRGQVALVEVDRAVQQRRPELARCVAQDALPPRGQLVLRLTIDRTGDVWRVATVRTDLPEPTTRCMTGAMETLVFTPPPAGLATADVIVSVGATPTADAGRAQKP